MHGIIFLQQSKQYSAYRVVSLCGISMWSDYQYADLKALDCPFQLVFGQNKLNSVGNVLIL